MAPFIIPLWTERSRTVSSLPSSMPVNSACSDFFWTTFSFSIIFAGRFLDASWGSSKKKVLPSMVILEMVSPFAVTVPSSATSTPGSFFRRSSSMSVSVVLKDDAVYSIVSFLMMIGLPVAVTFAALRTSTSGSIFRVPRSRSPFTSIS